MNVVEIFEHAFHSWKYCAIAVAAPLSVGYIVYHFLLKKDEQMGGLIRADHSRVEIVVAADKVGAIIGKEGSVIREIERTCNVCMKLKNLDQLTTDPDEPRTLTIRGKRDDVRFAEMKIRKLLADTPPTMTDAISVPRSALGTIIGNNIREISQISGARLTVNSTGNDFETITLKGKPQSIENAKMLIEEKVRVDQEYRHRIAEKEGNEKDSESLENRSVSSESSS